MGSDSRNSRRKLLQIEQNLETDEFGDRALVHAWVRMDWYRANMKAPRYGFMALETGALLLAGVTTVLAALSAPAWITATVAAAVTFLAGMHRIVSWDENWLAFSEAWAKLATLVSQYRILPKKERTEQRQLELVSKVDAVVLRETQGWGRRRRQLRSAAELEGLQPRPFTAPPIAGDASKGGAEDTTAVGRVKGGGVGPKGAAGLPDDY